MHPRTRLPDAAHRLAQAQAGVVATHQLLGLGLTRDQVRSLLSGFQPLARGVHLVTPTFGSPPFETRVWCGVLLGGRDARACGPTAAVLQGLTDPAPARERGARRDPEIHIVGGSGPRTPRPGFVFHREVPGVRLPSPPQDPPRTRIEDTVLDLCAAGTPEDVITWLTRACQRRLTTPDRLLTRLTGRPALRHRPLAIAVLGDVAAGVTSRLEHLALHEVFRPHGFPEVTLQARVGATGRIADAVLAEFALVVELDGRLGHVEEGSFRDRRRDNLHVISGLTTLRFGWWDVLQSPCQVARTIAEVLWQRGWTGDGTCPRCAGARGVVEFAG